MENKLEDLIAEFIKFYDGKIPNPEHNPVEFAYYVKLFKYYRNLPNKVA